VEQLFVEKNGVRHQFFKDKAVYQENYFVKYQYPPHTPVLHQQF
jgi:hypothetical protein